MTVPIYIKETYVVKRKRIEDGAKFAKRAFNKALIEKR